MFGERLADDQDTSARTQRRSFVRASVGSGSELAIELTQPRDCDRTVSLRERRKCGVKLLHCSDARSQVAQLDDLAADRQRREQLRALQRLAWSGKAASRAYIRPSQSSNLASGRTIARRRRSRT